MKCMKRKLWIRIGAVLLAGLLLWWLFWAILIDEDENEQSLPETEQIELFVIRQKDDLQAWVRKNRLE